jgi:hypothetical protein
VELPKVCPLAITKPEEYQPFLSQRKSGLRSCPQDRSGNFHLSQAFLSYDNVLRLRQEKEVSVHRLVVRDTVEDRYALHHGPCFTTDCSARSMLRLQETKKGLAQAALGEGGTIKLHKLSVKELKAVRYVPNPSVPSKTLIVLRYSCLE